MSSLGLILIADNEELSLNSTRDLLSAHGYECDSACDGTSAANMLRSRPYDLLIAELHLPGKSGLELVRELAREELSISTILVTGQPSLDSAIQSVRLPIVAYMVKPLDLADLLTGVRQSIQQARLSRALRDTTHYLKALQQNVQTAHQMSVKPSNAITSAEAFLGLTLQNIAGCLLDIKRVWDIEHSRPAESSDCQPSNCPRCAMLLQAVKDAVAVLEQTRHAFKSKQLAELRKQLEKVLVGAEPKSGSAR